MTATKYAFQEYDEKTMARAYGRGLSISAKKAVEVCHWIKGKSLSNAIKMLEDVVALRKAVPYVRFNQELAHQRATGSGGFPVNVAKSVIFLLKSAEANATSKGLNESSLRIVHICAHTGSRPFRHGRKRRVKAKRTHVEVVLKETEKKAAKSSKVAPSTPSKQSPAKQSPVVKETTKLEEEKKEVRNDLEVKENAEKIETKNEVKKDDKKENPKVDVQ